ncbi:hypothetical protein FHS85_005089 [Rhodoligotrophos appendicifer]|uniref:hypothetical protein n=1 Tax=Rhodoligotrophos appendicifer TaxID=987056 RepID=UPI0011870840|nr:hypothetical protein [Rhodoligotrophos appendicifer]
MARKYVRLSLIQWAQVRARWEAGENTLEELSAEFSVSRRAVQAHLSKHGVVKGAAAAEIAASVREEVFSECLDNHDLTLSRARSTREAAYAHALTIENLIMTQLKLASDPSQVARASAGVRMLVSAAAGLERLHELKYRALGLEKADHLQDQLPEIIIRDLSQEEITELQAAEEGDDDLESGLVEPLCSEDDVIVEL